MLENQFQEQDAFLALQSGEERGLMHYFNRYYSPLVLFSNAITHQYELAQEITSEAFHKLWQNRGCLKEVSSVKAYLYRLVQNASIDYLRQQKVERKWLTGFYAVTDQTQPNVFHKLVEAELYQQLHAALGQLPFRSRRIFELFYFEEKSLQEIAEELGISAAAVKSQKNRAMQLLRESKGSLFILASFLITLCFLA